MLPRSASASQSSAVDVVRIGVGIDTSRYGHYAAFLRDDLQPAAAELQFAESPAGYAQLRERLEHIARRHLSGNVHFVVRLDAAGQYADNLLHFLHRLAEQTSSPEDATANGATTRRADAATLAISWSISCGDPQRNKNYRVALYGNKKSDPYEARAAARYALSERPSSVTPLSLQLRVLRQIAARLQAVVRQRTRLIQQLHHLLALVFPELALLVKDIAAGWVLELLHRYPSASRLALATDEQLADVPYLPHRHIAALLEQARASVASLAGDAVEELVRDQVRQLRDALARQKRLEKLLVGAYRLLPAKNHLDTIPSIGEVTAAVLTAVMKDIDRFATANQLVAYFGTMPIEAASGVDRDGNPRGPRRYIMSRRGNDLVRRYLWMAALSAVRFNPAARALYARVVAKHPDKKGIALGHVMRKLLHLAFAVWKTNKPFNPEHYPWATPAHVEFESNDLGDDGNDGDGGHDGGQNEKTAGLKNPAEPVSKEVTTVCPSVAHDRAAPPPGARAPVQAPPVEKAAESVFIDFTHLKRQLPIAPVLDQLGIASRLRGAGPQKRCTCPIHRGDARGRTFSVHLDQGVFQCFDKSCAKKGDVIDLWAAVHTMSLRAAALDLVRTFNLEPAPTAPAHRNREENG